MEKPSCTSPTGSAPGATVQRRSTTEIDPRRSIAVVISVETPVPSARENYSQPGVLLHRRKRRRAQERDGHLLHDRAVLLAVGEHAGPLGVLGEPVELGHALVQARPGQHVDELVIVAADHVRPVAHLPEAVLLERFAGEAAEAITDVGDLLRHGLVLAQLEEVRRAARRVRPVGLAPVELGIRGWLHQLVVHAVDQRPVLLGLRPLLGPLGIGAPGGVFLGALLEAFPAPPVDDLVALLTDQGRPEADQAEPVLLPLVLREASEAVEERGQLAGSDVVATQLIEHDSHLTKDDWRALGYHRRHAESRATRARAWPASRCARRPARPARRRSRSRPPRAPAWSRLRRRRAGRADGTSRAPR